MLLEVFFQALADTRRARLHWGLGISLYALCLMAVFPALESITRQGSGLIARLLLLLETITGASGAAGSPVEWLNAAGFDLAFPLLLGGFAIFNASRLVADDEGRGMLELLVAYPLPRWRLLMEKFLALGISVALLAAWLWGLLALGVRSLGLEVSLAHLGGACCGLALLSLTYGGLAFVLAALTGRGRFSRLVSAGALALTYLAGADWLHRLSFLRYLSPFYYATGLNPLGNGFLPGHAWVLVLLIAICLAAAWVGFERRDLAV